MINTLFCKTVMGEKSFLVILSGQNCTLRTSAVRFKVCGKILVRVFFWPISIREVQLWWPRTQKYNAQACDWQRTKKQENILRKLLADIDGGSIWIVEPITTYKKKQKHWLTLRSRVQRLNSSS